MTHCTHTAGLEFRAASKSGNNQTGPNCVEVAGFRKAKKSNPSGNCVTVAHAKATASGGVGSTGTCVEPGVAREDMHADCTPATCLTPGINPGDIVVRDSKLGADSPLVVFRPQEWISYVAQVISAGMERDGEQYLLRDPRNPGLILRFTPAEEDAFRDGCTKGEFTYSEAAVSA